MNGVGPEGKATGKDRKAIFTDDQAEIDRDRVKGYSFRRVHGCLHVILHIVPCMEPIQKQTSGVILSFSYARVMINVNREEWMEPHGCGRKNQFLI
jgi:hypothetical protein